MAKNKLLVLSAFAALAVCLTGCGGDKGTHKSKMEDLKFTDTEVYKTILPDYNSLFNTAHQSMDNAERYVKFADAEAYLLDQAVILPFNTEGGRWGLSRVLPYTGPYARYGSDSSKYKGYKIIKTEDNKLLPTAQRNELKEDWKTAVETGWNAENTKEKFEANEKKKLDEWGYTTFYTDYTTLFSSMPTTLDYLASSHAQDSDVTTNLVDNLFEHDRFGDIVPALALSKEVDATGKVYTIHLRQNVRWVNSAGQDQGEVVADDFVAGMQHLLDAKGGSEDIMNSILVGAQDYSDKKITDFSQVGIKAIDNYTLEVSFNRELPYADSLFTFSVFAPLNRSFFLSKGGAFGIDEFRNAKGGKNYTYGSLDPTSILYNGAYRLTEITATSGITYLKNNSYWDASSITLNSVELIYTADLDASTYLDQVIEGEYAGASLTEETYTQAVNKGYENCIYRQDTAAGTFIGAFNFNRKTYSLDSGRRVSVKSPKAEDGIAKNLTRVALLNKNFRKAFYYAINKANYNETTAGRELRTASLRNMFTDPEFVTLPNDYDGYTAHTSYGEIVQEKLNARLAVYNQQHTDWKEKDENNQPTDKQLIEAIDLSDGVDGWYQEQLAEYYFNLAKEELLDEWADEFGGREAMEKAFPVQIDVVYLMGNDKQVTSLQASIKRALGTKGIQINAVEAGTESEYLASTYMVASGEAANYDFYCGSGWIPDYADPATFLETLVPGGNGYLTKTLGLW